MKTGIYTITAPSGKQYVGSAASFRHRWSSHRIILRRNTHPNVMLQNAFNKYGEDGLIFAKVIICEKKDLVLYEQAAMDALKPVYNLLKFARSPLGYKHSIEAREKIRASRIGRRHLPESIEKMRIAQLGKIIPAEQVERMKAALRGQKRTEEQRANVSAAVLRRPPASAQTRGKLSASHSGRKRSTEHAAKLRVLALGLKRTDETKERMSLASKAFCLANKDLVAERVRSIHLGKKRSPEARARMSAGIKNARAKKVGVNA